VRKRIWASAVGTNQVQINGANPDPQVAHQLAQATIDTFIQWKINLDRTDSVTAGDFFENLIEEYEADVVEAQQALRSYLELHPEPVRDTRPDTEQLEIQNLQAELDAVKTRLAQAMDKAENVRLAESQVESTIRQRYTLVDAPGIPDKPATSRRQMAMNAAIFVVAGVFLSGIAVLGAAVLERSFRIPADVRHELELPVLAIIPDVSVPMRRRWPRKPKRAAPEADEMLEPAPELAQETTVLTALRHEIPELVQREHSRGRNKKGLATDETPELHVDAQEEKPIALDLQAFQVDIKHEQQVGK
jgi:hypothetical protein